MLLTALVYLAAREKSFYKPNWPRGAESVAPEVRLGVFKSRPGKTPVRQVFAPAFLGWSLPHGIARQLQMLQDPEGRQQDLRLLQFARRREERPQGHFTSPVLAEGAA